MRLLPTEPQLAYKQRGDRGERVLLVMGMGMPGQVWEPQIEDLGHDHQLAWFDNRGIGMSGHDGRTFTTRDLADDAARVLDALGWERAHVVGVSLGGMISQEVALRHGTRVTSLTLIATHAGGPLGVMPHPRGIGAFLAANLGRDRAAGLSKLLYPKEYLQQIDREALEARTRMQAVRQPRRTVMQQLYAVMRHDTRRRLEAIRAPTLVIKPKADILVRPFHSDRLARGIPGAKLLELDGAGHGVIFQCASQVNAAIREHIQSAR